MIVDNQKLLKIGKSACFIFGSIIGPIGIDLWIGYNNISLISLLLFVVTTGLTISLIINSLETKISLLMAFVAEIIIGICSHLVLIKMGELEYFSKENILGYLINSNNKTIYLGTLIFVMSTIFIYILFVTIDNKFYINNYLKTIFVISIIISIISGFFLYGNVKSNINNVKDAYTVEIAKNDLAKQARNDGAIKIEDNWAIFKDNIIRYVGNDSNVTVPSKINNTKTVLDSSLFKYNKNIVNIIFDNGITSIPNNVCSKMEKLKEVTLNNSVAKIDIRAFNECSSLETILLSQNLSEIKEYAFYNCSSLKEINLPNSITSIGEYAFKGCSKISSLKIPEGITTLNAYAFVDCTSISSLRLPDSLTEIKDDTFSGCTGLTEIIIPENVTKIGTNAFYGCTLVNKIEFNAKNCKQISIGVFEGNNNPIDLIYGNQCENINEDLFKNVKLNSITFGKKITKINENSFEKQETLTKVIFNCDLQEIGKNAFKDCSQLAQIEFNGTLLKINESAFENCETVGNIVLPETVTIIDKKAFYGCSNLIVDIPAGINQISEEAFYGCLKLTKVILPQKLSILYLSAFNNCNSLTDIYIYNDKCVIYDSGYTMGKKITINGQMFSTAERIANNKGYLYKNMS